MYLDKRPTMSARELMQSRKHHQLWLSGLRQFASVGLMFRFSGGALNFVPWHFIHHTVRYRLLGHPMLSLQPRSTLSARSPLVTGRAHLDADGGAYLILLVGSDRKRDDERDCGNHEQIPAGAARLPDVLIIQVTTSGAVPRRERA